MDKRFILLVSVGLIVRAPRPEAWLPGIMDILLLLLEEGVPAFPPACGDLGARVEKRLCSGVSVDAPSKLAWLVRGGGRTDLALVALEAGKLRVESEPATEAPSIDRLDEFREPPLSPKRLARRACAFRVATSESVTTPGPIDFRGGLGGATGFDTGG